MRGKHSSYPQELGINSIYLFIYLLVRERKWESWVSRDGKSDWIDWETLNESNEATNESYKDSKINLRISMGSLPFCIWSSAYEQNFDLFEEGGTLYALSTIWLSWATQHRPLVAKEQSCQKAVPVLKPSL